MRKFALLITGAQTRMIPRKYHDSLIYNLNKLSSFVHKKNGVIYIGQTQPSRLGVIDKCLYIPSSATIWNKDDYKMYSYEIHNRLVDEKVTDIILAGCDTHWCVQQTAEEIMSRDKHPDLFVPYDATCSHETIDKKMAYERMKHMGVIPCSTNSYICNHLTRDDIVTDQFLRANKRKKSICDPDCNIGCKD